MTDRAKTYRSAEGHSKPILNYGSIVPSIHSKNVFPSGSTLIYERFTQNDSYLG